MKNALGDAMEKIGAKIAPILINLSEGVKNLAINFNGVSDGAMRLILLLGGLVAAIGPLFFIVSKISYKERISQLKVSK